MHQEVVFLYDVFFKVDKNVLSMQDVFTKFVIFVFFITKGIHRCGQVLLSDLFRLFLRHMRINEPELDWWMFTNNLNRSWQFFLFIFYLFLSKYLNRPKRDCSDSTKCDISLWEDYMLYFSYIQSVTFFPKDCHFVYRWQWRQQNNWAGCFYFCNESCDVL